MDMDLLGILVCPKTKKKLVIANDETLNKINQKISSGKCRDISGEPVLEKVAEGLYEPDQKIFYIIRDGIPLLIYDNGISIDHL